MEHQFTPTHYHTTLGSHEPVLRVSDGDTIITTTVDARGSITIVNRSRRGAIHRPDRSMLKEPSRVIRWLSNWMTFDRIAAMDSQVPLSHQMSSIPHMYASYPRLAPAKREAMPNGISMSMLVPRRWLTRSQALGDSYYRLNR